MADLNDKDLEKATGGKYFSDHPSADNLKKRGFTLITDESKGFNCDDFYAPWEWNRGPCSNCYYMTIADDTHEMFCTRGK